MKAEKKSFYRFFYWKIPFFGFLKLKNHRKYYSKERVFNCFQFFRVHYQVFFCKTKEVCSRIAEIRIRVQNDPKDTVFVLATSKNLNAEHKKHMTQNTCAQHTNPGFPSLKSRRMPEMVIFTAGFNLSYLGFN